MGKRISEDERRIARHYARRTLTENIAVKDMASIAYNARIFPDRSWKAIQVMICQERQAIDPSVKRKKDDPVPVIIPSEPTVPEDNGKQCSMFDRFELNEQSRVVAVRALQALGRVIDEVIDLMEGI